MSQNTLLVVISCLDLSRRLGCTPAWWQLLMAMWRQNTRIICTPYLGPATASPWWEIESNPCRIEGEIFSVFRNWARRLSWKPDAIKGSGSGIRGVAINGAITAWVRPRWKKHLFQILERNPAISAVLILTVPPNHLRGIPAAIRERFQIPVWFYDGDTPASLPAYGGFASGFRTYEGADLGEFDGVICNSEGSMGSLFDLGAKSVEIVHWGADPHLFPQYPAPRHEVFDVGFYGIGEVDREDWIRRMVGQPSQNLSQSRFAVFGDAISAANTGRAERLPFFPFQNLPYQLSTIRILLNISRSPHATVLASSSCRLFELAASGCCVVSNPVNGIERWFEPGVDVCVVENADEACTAYRYFLGDAGARKEMGQRARQRIVEQHTYAHRAKQLLGILGRGT